MERVIAYVDGYNLYYGLRSKGWQRFYWQNICRQCGHTYTTYHEKMTDVNISVEMMTDALQDKFDTALLISADSDLVSPVKAVRQFFHKRLVAVFPPGRSSFALKQAANGVLHISHVELAKSVFPDEIIKPDGVILRRPAKWR